MTRFPDKIYATLPAGVSDLVQSAADSRSMLPSQYIRTAIVEKLRADGVKLPEREAA